MKKANRKQLLEIIAFRRLIRALIELAAIEKLTRLNVVCNDDSEHEELRWLAQENGWRVWFAPRTPHGRYHATLSKIEIAATR